MTSQQFEKLTGKLSADFLPLLNDTLHKYQIDSTLRTCHFMAQLLHESGGLKYNTENLNYSAAGLLSTFPKYFTKETALLYSHKPEKIANRVYANRLGNGNQTSGDGWKYRGRGGFQLTGKANYNSFSKDMKDDLINNPDKVATKYFFEVAGWYWNLKDLNKLADQDDITTITKRISGAQTGLSHRKQWLTKCKSIL